MGKPPYVPSLSIPLIHSPLPADNSPDKSPRERGYVCPQEYRTDPMPSGVGLLFQDRTCILVMAIWVCRGDCLPGTWDRITPFTSPKQTKNTLPLIGNRALGSRINVSNELGRGWIPGFHKRSKGPRLRRGIREVTFSVLRQIPRYSVCLACLETTCLYCLSPVPCSSLPYPLDFFSWFTLFAIAWRDGIRFAFPVEGREPRHGT